MSVGIGEWSEVGASGEASEEEMHGGEGGGNNTHHA